MKYVSISNNSFEQFLVISRETNRYVAILGESVSTTRMQSRI